MDDTTIILIGPIGSGKSTIAQLLSEQCGLPRQSLDALRWDYYAEIGYDEKTAAEINEKEGFAGVYRYWKPFEVHAVERVLAEHPGSVIDFGAGHSVFETEELFLRARAALEPFQNVVLLLPSEDPEESMAILQARYIHEPDEDEAAVESIMAVNEHFVRHPSNRRLARLVVYTKGKNPAETCAEIVQWVKAARATYPPVAGEDGKTPIKD